MLTRPVPWLALLTLAACAGGAAGGGNGGDGGWLDLKTGGTGPTMQISGTVQHLEIEGGVFVIRDDKGNQYSPLNLPKDFQVDGTPIEVEARERADMASVGMAGPLIEILRIRKGEARGTAAVREENSGGIAGTSWKLSDLEGAPALESVEVTLEFQQEGTVSGNASCNQFRGPATVQPNGKLTFGALATTRKFCTDEKVMQQEKAYLAALGKVERYEVSANTLTLSAAGAPLLRFVRKSA